MNRPGAVQTRNYKTRETLGSALSALDIPNDSTVPTTLTATNFASGGARQDDSATLSATSVGACTTNAP
jgi:hypothetical protein